MKIEEKESYFRYFYSNPILGYCQNWGHIITEKMLGTGMLTLDMGCGAFDHVPFTNPSKTYIELDIDIDVLQIGKKRHPVGLAVCGDAEALPFKTNCFDNILSVFNLEHIGNLASCVSELARVLKPSGCLAVCIPTEGFIFRLGRKLVSARYAKRHFGLKTIREYEQMVARSHVNSLENVLAILTRDFFLDRKIWFPFPVLGWKNLNINLAIRAFPLT